MRWKARQMVSENILICGSRSDFNVVKVIASINKIVDDNSTALFIHGGARGVDRIADNILKLKNVNTEVHNPDYYKYGKVAPLIRDNEMVDKADKIYAFWNGRSKGTKYVISYSKEKHKNIEVIQV